MLQEGCQGSCFFPCHTHDQLSLAPTQAAEVFKTVLSDMVAHRYTPFSRDSCTIIYEVGVHMLPRGPTHIVPGVKDSTCWQVCWAPA